MQKQPESVGNSHPPTRIAEGLDTATIALSPVNKFKEYLEFKQKKLTSERIAMVAYIFERHNHFDADQLMISLREKQIPVSRSTVYRTLALLVESGLLRTLEFGPTTYYEHDYGYPHHEHMYCTNCGEVIEFQTDEVNEFIEKVTREHRFRVTNHKLIIQGICEKCNRTRHRKLDLI
jgi:Fur family ferric uptake transcriptional regulator